MWLWEGQPELSPTLAELIEARITQVPKPVRDILDALAVTEPLDTDVLAALADPGALAEAESLGLASVDPSVRPASVRLTHPMLGEVRRTGSLRLARLRGRIATELARKDSSDPRDLVRRAVLTIDSDLTPDPELLLAAAACATQLSELRLAEVLAEHAVAAGRGIGAQIAHAMTITWQERGLDAETILAELAELADQTSGPLRAQIAVLRAMNFAVFLGQLASAERELEVLPADDDATQAIASALRASIDIVRGHAQSGVDRANAVLSDPPADAVVQMLSIGALVSGLGDLGCIDQIESVANRGYRLAERSAEVSHLRLPLAFLHAFAYRLAGALTQSDATIARIRRDTLDVPFEGSSHAFLAGLSAMSRGDLVETQRLRRESLAYLGTGDTGRMVKGFGRSWLAVSAAMAGRDCAARQWAHPPKRSVSPPSAKGHRRPRYSR